MFGSFPSAGFAQIGDHRQRTLVVLDHAGEKQLVELRAARGVERLHLLGREHARHGRHVPVAMAVPSGMIIGTSCFRAVSHSFIA